jgi:hypothetical protein
MLQQEIDTNRQMLDRLLQSQQGSSSRPRVCFKNSIRIDRKLAPRHGRPVEPKRGQNILLSALLALIGGVGLVLFLDYINNKIQSVEDIDRYLQAASARGDSDAREQERRGGDCWATVRRVGRRTRRRLRRQAA